MRLERFGSVWECLFGRLVRLVSIIGLVWERFASVWRRLVGASGSGLGRLNAFSAFRERLAS